MCHQVVFCRLNARAAADKKISRRVFLFAIYNVSVYFHMSLNGIESYGIESYSIESYGIESYSIESYGVYGVKSYGIKSYGIILWY
jgi:hypothetical protein